MSTPDREGKERETNAYEVEVPGTPEAVWEAMATGPGITAWFIPTEVEPREGGATDFEVMPGVHQAGTVSAWEPPARYVIDETWTTAGGHSIEFATEFLVEARAGGTCVVRVVASAFGSGEDWRDEIGGAFEGWPTMLDNLRIYLARFAGQPSGSVRALGMSEMEQEEAWWGLRTDLGLFEAEPGQRVSVDAAGVRFAGVVESVGDDEIKVILEEPGRGLATVMAVSFGGTFVALAAYLYGEGARDVAEEIEPAWRDWVAVRFPMPETPPV